MKLLKRITCALLSIILVNLSFAVPVFAAEESSVVELEATVTANYGDGVVSYADSRSTTFSDTSIYISYSSEGMHIVICTDLTMTASVVGVKDIQIQKKGLLGTWTTVATSDGGEVTNASGCVTTLDYAGAEYGETYRVTCIHYGNVDGYRELYHETVGAKCVY